MIRSGPQARPCGRVRPTAASAFSLVELLMVVAIVGIALAMLDSVLGQRVIRGNVIANAAYELAGTLRHARQLSMDNHGIYGVTFNIQNAPGSSGAVLNNRSGDHWYRIVRPHDKSWQGTWSLNGYSMPLPFNRSLSNNNTGAGDTEVWPWLRNIRADFMGERVRLPKGQVRFIALTDEDNGNFWTPQSAFAPTYPRPWFGDFLSVKGGTPRFYAWGGYEGADTTGAFLDNSKTLVAGSRPLRPTVNFSGFYYEGDDGALTGCENPADRFVVNRITNGAIDTTGVSDPHGGTAVPGEDYQLFTQGQVRPLVNGDWEDFVIIFNPDGTAGTLQWMMMRHAYGQSGTQFGPYAYWNDWQHKNLMQLGPGDMCNQVYPQVHFGGGTPYNTMYEASSYASVTGEFYITIGADAPDDTVQFPNAQAALAAMMPLYRVGVSKLGEVEVFRVQTAVPAGATFDPKWADGIYQTTGIGMNGYWNNCALNPATGQPCLPAEDFVTADMLEHQRWWIDQ